jgi:hypothetical protein
MNSVVTPAPIPCDAPVTIMVLGAVSGMSTGLHSINSTFAIKPEKKNEANWTEVSIDVVSHDAEPRRSTSRLGVF